MVSNKCHERKRQVNQSHAPGSDNFNGAEEVNTIMYVMPYHGFRKAIARLILPLVEAGEEPLEILHTALGDR